MKRLYLAILILVTISVLLYIAIPALKRVTLAKESGRAVTALADCYRFVFVDTMDKAVMGQPTAIPATLDNVPGWTDFVNKSEPAAQALYRRIDWHPPRNPSEGDEIASIELPNSRAILLHGGAAFTVRKVKGEGSEKR